MAHSTSNQIYSKSTQQYWSLWIVALVWNSSVWFAIIKAQQGILSALEANPVFYFILTFPLIGLWIIFKAIKQTLAWYKFGKTPLNLNPYPGQVGGYCAGQLDLPIAAQDVQHAILSLSCIHRYLQRKNTGKQCWQADMLWQDTVTLKPDKYGRKTRINFSFSPPADLPETEPNSHDYHSWSLQVRLPLPGIDYERTFELPMQAANQQELAAVKHERIPNSTQVDP